MYVGQRKLKYKHKGNSWKTYLGSGTHLHNAIKKYGADNFDRKIIDISFDATELNELEYFYSKIFNVVDSANWYNIVYGGGVDGLNITNSKQTPVIRYNMNGEKIGEYPSILNGASQTGDGRQSIFSCCIGKFHKVEKSNTVWRYKDDPFDKYPLEAVEQNKPLKCYNKFQELIAIYNGLHDAERQTKIDRSSITKCCDGRACCAGIYIWCFENDTPIYNYEKMSEKPLYQYDVFGNYIARYNSSKEAGEKLNINHLYINLCCNKKTKTSGGYKWFYVNDPEQPRKDKILYSNV